MITSYKDCKINKSSLEKANYKVHLRLIGDSSFDLIAKKKHRGFNLVYSSNGLCNRVNGKGFVSQLSIDMEFKGKKIQVLSWFIDPEETIEQMEDYFETFFKQLEKY